MQDTVAAAGTEFHHFEHRGIVKDQTIPSERHEGVTDDGILRGILQIVATDLGSEFPCRLQTIAATAVLKHCFLLTRCREKQSPPREGHERVADDGVLLGELQVIATDLIMQRIGSQKAVASFRALVEDREGARFGQQGVMPEEGHEGVADGGIDLGKPQIRAADLRLQIVCHEHTIAAVLIMIKDRERAWLGQQGVMPEERHEGIANDGIHFRELQFRTRRRTVIHREMERCARRAAVSFGLHIHPFGSDAKAVPSGVGQFDGIERQLLPQGDISPAVTIELQAVRGILPEVVIRCFETAFCSHFRLENIR